MLHKATAGNTKQNAMPSRIRVHSVGRDQAWGMRCWLLDSSVEMKRKVVSSASVGF